MDIKKVLKQIKKELAKLKNIDNEEVKGVYTNLNKCVEDLKTLDVKKEEPKKEVVEEEVENKDSADEEEGEESAKKEDEADLEEEEEAKDSEKEEVKTEEVKKEDIKEDVKEELSAKAVKNSGIELSLAVSNKLKQAALELKRSNDMVAAKDEVIGALNNQIIELNADLKAYKDAESAIEEEKFQVKVNKLVELYAGMGISKEAKSLELSFSEEQIDALIIDLSAVQRPVVENKRSISKRKTSVSADLELSKYNSNDAKSMSAEDVVNTLFDEFM